MRSEGGSNPLGCAGCGEENWWTGIIYGELTNDREDIS
jgi:hypothetical protein